MRVSTPYLFRQGVDAMQRQQSRLARTQEQVATGKRILSPADDPSGAARLLDLGETLAQTRQFQRNADRAVSRLSLEDSILDRVGNVLQRVRELALQGNNDVLTSRDRGALAQEAGERLEELLSLANTRDGNREYMFAGFATATRPFARGGAGFVYYGDQGQRRLPASSGYQVTVGDAGSDVFQRIRNGNGTFSTGAGPGNTGDGVIGPGTVSGTFIPDNYTIRFTGPAAYVVEDGGGAPVTSGAYATGAAIVFNGAQVTIAGTPVAGDTFTVTTSVNQDMFTTLENLVTSLTSNTNGAANQARFHSRMNGSIVDIDRALDQVLMLRASVGSRLNSVENEQLVSDELEFQLQATISSIQDVDLSEAVTRLNLQGMTLEAAQRSFAVVSRLSLFDFL